MCNPKPNLSPSPDPNPNPTLTREQGHGGTMASPTSPSRGAHAHAQVDRGVRTPGGSSSRGLRRGSWDAATRASPRRLATSPAAQQRGVGNNPNPNPNPRSNHNPNPIPIPYLHPNPNPILRSHIYGRQQSGRRRFRHRWYTR